MADFTSVSGRRRYPRLKNLVQPRVATTEGRPYGRRHRSGRQDRMSVTDGGLHFYAVILAQRVWASGVLEGRRNCGA